MGKCRFLYDNLITDEAMLAVSSLRYGLVMGALKEGSGSAVLSPSGNYTGTADKEYIVEIDSIASGAEVGQATFRWSDGGGGWNASGVVTSATPVLLAEGVYVQWVSGAGADFVVGDRWYFKTINLFNAGKMIDVDRDHRYRSAALQSPNTVTVDLGSAREISALVLFDHNITAAATITLKGNDTNSWGSPAFSEILTWNAGKILHYLSSAQTYRYWRIEISDASNPYGYIEIGELFLGSYLELSKNYSLGRGRSRSLLQNVNETSYGKKRRRFFNLRNTFTINFEYLTKTDVQSLEAMVDSLVDRSSGTTKPFYYNEDSDYPDNHWMVSVSNLDDTQNHENRYTSPLELEEEMTSV